MRLTSLCLLASLAVFSACGSSPRYFQVAIDRSSLDSLPGSCYIGGNAPTITDKSTNVMIGQQWTLYDGEQGKSYLAIGDLSNFHLGDASAVSVRGNVIQGGPTSFTTTRTRVDPTRTITTTATVTFTQLDTTAKGTIKLDSSTACTGMCNAPNCSGELPFLGHQLQVNPEMNYSPI